MPIIIIDRLPLPSFKTYVALSVGLFSIALYHGIVSTDDPEWKSGLLNDAEDQNKTLPLLSNVSRNDLPDSKLKELLLFMLEDSLCFWGFLNAIYCALVILSKLIQITFFGNLRSIEVQHLKDRLYTFIIYKFVFIFGIINVQFIDEVLFWLLWFTVIGFLQVLSQLCKDRFEYLSLSPVFLKGQHAFLIFLLGLLSSVSCSLFVACLSTGASENGFSAFTFMLAESILLVLKLSHTIIRYCLYLYDTWNGLVGTQTESLWKRRGPVAYYVEFTFELLALGIELVHYLHMLIWVWANMFLSIASFMICMQLKVICQEIKVRIQKHRKYCRVVEHMEKNYPMASSQDLAENSDKCPICWESMSSARKLPCAHLFHSSCLQSWLEQDTSCPTCRLSLNIHSMGSMDNVEPDLNNRGRPNHFFHFDGSRYISWLPSFSVEVTHNQLVRAGDLIRDTSQLDSMAREIQLLFPNFPLSVISEDLQVTRSLEFTVENILEGRLILPPQLIILDDESPTSSTSSSSETNSVSTSDEITSDNHSETAISESVEELETLPENIEEQFSRSSEEREKILHFRREKLLRDARKKYINKLGSSTTENVLDPLEDSGTESGASSKTA